MTIIPGYQFFIQKGECPDCFEELERREYGVEDDDGWVTAVTIEYCNECDEAKDISVDTFRPLP